MYLYIGLAGFEPTTYRLSSDHSTIELQTLKLILGEMRFELMMTESKSVALPLGYTP